MKTYRLFDVTSVFSLKLGRGTPVPYSDELKRMIINYIFERPSDINGDSILDFVTGKSSTIPDPEEEFRRLNISVLDTDAIRKVAQLAKEKGWEEQMKRDVDDSKMTRRLSKNRHPNQAWFLDWQESKIFMQQGIDMMQQAVYATRYNLKRTKPFRKRFRTSQMFLIGTLFGMLMQMRIKIETTHHMLSTFDHLYMKFHWYVIVYEKVLQAHTDITLTVQRMFELYKVVKKKRNNPVFLYAYRS